MNNKANLSLFILTLLFCAGGICFAVSAAPGFFETVQPDGTKIEIQMKGDEFYGWTEDKDGYTVIQDNNKEWRYAQEAADGSLKLSSFKVGKEPPQTLRLPKGLKHRDYMETARKRRAQMQPQNEDNPILRRLRSSSLADRNASAGASSSQGTFSQEDLLPEQAPSAGIVKNLVVLVAFADMPFTLPNPKQQFDDLYNKTGYTGPGGKGSVKEFFLKTSYGNLTVESVLTDIITLDNPAAYYGNNSSSQDWNAREMVTEALGKLEAAGFDFSQFQDDTIEGVTIIHAGRGEEAGGGADTIWSHKWAIPKQKFGGKYVNIYNTAPELYYSSITTIGVLCHEFGHVIGLPDLYDTSDNSEGVGNFCLMGGGSWNHSGGNQGNSPSLLSAWCKKQLGYITVQNLPSNSAVSIAEASEDSSAFYKFSGAGFNSKEYFLIENRQGTSFDAGLPGPNRGILIWHIDDRKSGNASRVDFLADVEEADGSNDLYNKTNRGKDSHYFRAGNKTEFTDTSTPNSKSKSGQSSGYFITGISASGAVMTFNAASYVTGAVNSVLPSTITRTISTFTITGENLIQGSLVKLINGGVEINASSVSFTSTSSITAVFPIFSSAPTGYWSLQVSSWIYSNNPIIKSSAVFVKGDMSISDVSPAFAFAGSSQTVEIEGTDYQSGVSVKLLNGSDILTGTVLSVSQTAIKSSFQIPEYISHGEQFDLTVTNISSDFITKTKAVSVYRTPLITQINPLYAEPGMQAVLSVSGENFSPFTKIILRKTDDPSTTIIPQITSCTASSLTVSFTPQHLHLGKWKIYYAAVEGGQETEFGQMLEIKYPETSSSTLNLKAYAGGGIVFQVRSVNGSLNDGYALIPEMTFNKDVDITIKQRLFFADLNLNEGTLKHSNIGVSVSAQNKMNANGIILKIPYTQDDVAELDENNLAIAVYNEERGVWLPLKSFTDKDNKLVCAQIDRLGLFAIMGIGASSSLENIKYYPNPVRHSKGLSYARMNFANLPAGCKIIIYTQLGRIVQKLEADGSGMAVWDAKNSLGEYVSSGVYIAYFQDKNGNKKKIRIAVER
jgi:M6 family metalloprotease-like protein